MGGKCGEAAFVLQPIYQKLSIAKIIDT